MVVGEGCLLNNWLVCLSRGQYFISGIPECDKSVWLVSSGPPLHGSHDPGPRPPTTGAQIEFSLLVMDGEAPSLLTNCGPHFATCQAIATSYCLVNKEGQPTGFDRGCAKQLTLCRASLRGKREIKGLFWTEHRLTEEETSKQTFPTVKVPFRPREGRKESKVRYTLLSIEYLHDSSDSSTVALNVILNLMNNSLQFLLTFLLNSSSVRFITTPLSTLINKPDRSGLSYLFYSLIFTLLCLYVLPPFSGFFEFSDNWKICKLQWEDWRGTYQDICR